MGGFFCFEAENGRHCVTIQLYVDILCDTRVGEALFYFYCDSQFDT